MSKQIKLGDRVRDCISGFQGIFVADCKWLNGCRRVTIQSEQLSEGKPIDSCTFDAEQVELVLEQIMPGPESEKKTGGPSIAPTRNRDPR